MVTLCSPWSREPDHGIDFQIAPFPYDLVKEECDKYPDAEVVWSQEEHKNMGGWSYVQPRVATALNHERHIS